jgi:hypothetical protein
MQKPMNQLETRSTYIDVRVQNTAGYGMVRFLDTKWSVNPSIFHQIL